MPPISVNDCPPGATVVPFSVCSHCPVCLQATNHLLKVYQHNLIGYKGHNPTLPHHSPHLHRSRF